MKLPIITMAAVLLTLTGCERRPQQEPLSQTAGFVLPEAISNNAVAVADGPDGPTLYSFNGLKAGKTWTDTSNAAFACVIATARTPPTSANGRFTATSNTLRRLPIAT